MLKVLKKMVLETIVGLLKIKSSLKDLLVKQVEVEQQVVLELLQKMLYIH
jgi:hypothetical protein